MIDVSVVRLFLLVLTGWLDRREREVIAYLVEENRLLYRQLGRRRLRLTDVDRRRLAARAQRLGRRVLRDLATIVTPDTLLRWHRQLIARKWTYAGRRGRRGVMADIRRLVVRMAEENPTWGYTRIQGALQNVGHRVGRSTMARLLRAHGLPPAPRRPTSWSTFLKAHGGAIAGADFFTTEVWTWRGLVTYYTVFVIDLQTRRVQIAGSTPYPDEPFMQQVCRTLTAPNANAYAGRFVRSIKDECLSRVIPLGERHFRHVVAEYVAHYHGERNHQGLANALIDGDVRHRRGPIRRRPRLGGVLNYYERAA